MGKYLCPDCGYDGDEPICPYCNKVAAPLDLKEESLSLNEKYSPEEMRSSEDLAEEELKEELRDAAEDAGGQDVKSRNY